MPGWEPEMFLPSVKLETRPMLVINVRTNKDFCGRIEQRQQQKQTNACALRNQSN